MFPATLFDYNGVLADDESLHLVAFRETLRPFGIELSDQDYWEKYLGFDDAGAFRAIFADAGRGIDEEQVRSLIERKRPVYLEHASASLVTFEGARDAILQRAKHGPVCVVSGALRDEIELGLSLLGVRAEVPHIVSAEDTRACKPDPEGYELGKVVLRKLAGDLAAERALVIEDSVAGVQAAKAARLPCLAVTHSYPEPVLKDAGADLVIERLSHLTDHVVLGLYRRLYA